MSDYKVLARKYRSQTFDDLIGQDVLVQTLKNAIIQNRIAHGYVLTGIRGVGKTSTARILAKALNCSGANNEFTKATITPCNVCQNCKAITSSQHIDVIEIDAASNTGVENIRELLENISYAPALSRYKIYIIDEVHMLSKNAFNALLKTLEEPPSHVIFILATTDIEKIPVTVLSRCQRFDLPRVKAEVLLTHYCNICKKEGIPFEETALKLIANNADGSVRDGLSLLDQGISLSKKNLTYAIISSMLGLNDKSQIFKLFDYICSGDIENALKTSSELYNLGADPKTIITDLMEINYCIMRYKLSKNINEFLYSSEDIDIIKNLSEVLSIPALTKLWQMLTKGFEEIKENNNLKSFEMFIVRICYLSTQPLPADIIRKLTNSEIVASVKKEEKKAEKNIYEITNLDTLLNTLSIKNETLLKSDLESKVIFESFGNGKIILSVPKKEDENIMLKLKSFLLDHTNINWDISIMSNSNYQTVQKKKIDAAMNNEMVNDLINSFGAKIETIN